MCAALAFTALTACAGEATEPAACPGRTSPQTGALRLTLQSLTTGAPPARVDPAAVRGTVVLTVNVGADLLPAAGARLELEATFADGTQRVLATAPVAVPAGADVAAVPLTVATGAGGARGVPNGAQVWTAALVAGAVSRADCARLTIGAVPLQVTVANP